MCKVPAAFLRLSRCSSYPSNQSIANDWGYIKLSSNAGNTCGWFGIGYTTKANLEAAKFTVCGYPGDKVTYNKDSKMHGQNVQMWRHSGKLTKVQTGSLKYKIDTEIGQSGYPIYDSSTKIVYGIHHGDSVLGSTNSGARITKGILYILKGYWCLQIREIAMNKKIVTIIVLIIIVADFCSCRFNDSPATNSATVEGYIKKVFLDDSKILICYDFKDTLNEEYMGDCYIPIEEDTVISDDRTPDSIEQGEHIIVSYIGTLAESFPAQIDGTILIQFVK